MVRGALRLLPVGPSGTRSPVKIIEKGRDVEFLNVATWFPSLSTIACGSLPQLPEGKETGICFEHVNGDRAGAAFGYVDMVW